MRGVRAHWCRFVTRRPKLFLVALTTFLVFLVCKIIPVHYFLNHNFNYYLTQDGFYLLISPTCRIVNLNPWNDEAIQNFEKKPYYSCATSAIYTELVVEENDIDVYLHRHHEILPHEFPNFTCCVSNITRPRFSPTNYTYNDNHAQLSDCIKFQSFPIKVSNEHPTLVRCLHPLTSQSYENVHQPVALTDGVLQKLARSKANRKTSNRLKNHLSVLFLGIDSVSRLNLIRTMPHTYNLLQSDPSWLEFKIFQKMGDNTLPNLMAILTGYNSSQGYDICKVLEAGGLDNCDLIWNKFSDRGYVTAYAEDLSQVSTFNFHKPGFNNTPVDYYTRAYQLGASQHLPTTVLDGSLYCTGLVQDGERVWNVAVDVVRMHKNHPYFGFFWTNSYSHEGLNTPARMDDKVRDYLLEISDMVDNTLIIFLSDHGMRFGPIRNTLTGYLEERLPFLYFRFPKWFPQRFPDEYAILKMNTQRMVTPYDIHMTLQSVLKLADESYEIQPSLGCPKCRSLFELVPLERSCQDAEVGEHWCTCSNLVEIDGNMKPVKMAADAAVARLNAHIVQLNGEKICQYFHLDTVLKSFQATNHYGGNDDLIVVEFQTFPKAQFEVSIHTGNMEMYGGFSRLDSYQANSGCTNDPSLKMFCYCKETRLDRTDII